MKGYGHTEGLLLDQIAIIQKQLQQGEADRQALRDQLSAQSEQIRSLQAENEQLKFTLQSLVSVNK